MIVERRGAMPHSYRFHADSFDSIRFDDSFGSSRYVLATCQITYGMISDQMEDRPEDRKDEIRAMRAFLLAWFHHEPPSNLHAYSSQSLSNRHLPPPSIAASPPSPSISQSRPLSSHFLVSVRSFPSTHLRLGFLVGIYFMFCMKQRQ